MGCKDTDRNKEFVCQTCGRKLSVWKAQTYYSFNKEELQKAEDAEDFDIMFQPAYTAIQVQCTNCNNPELQKEDAEWLSGYSEEINYER